MICGFPAKVTVDYNHTAYFEKYVDPSYHLKYVILVSNGSGPQIVKYLWSD